MQIAVRKSNKIRTIEVTEMSKKKKKTLMKRYNRTDRVMHWTVAAGFILALLTGYAVFFEGSSKLLVNEVGYLIRLLHRIGGVIFVVAPILYFIFSKNRFGFLEAFKWSKEDLGWLLAAPKHYFVGGEMPPQGKYNTGQKLYYLSAIICGVMLALSGFALWFNWFSPTGGLIMLFIHDLSAVFITLFFFVHVYLTVFHPHDRTSFNAMASGYMDKEYAKTNHKKWYDKEMKKAEQEDGKQQKSS